VGNDDDDDDDGRHYNENYYVERYSVEELVQEEEEEESSGVSISSIADASLVRTSRVDGAAQHVNGRKVLCIGVWVSYGMALYLPKSVSLFMAMSICVRSVELRESSSAMREFCLFVSLYIAVQCLMLR
jgi:hypothetical protein